MANPHRSSVNDIIVLVYYMHASISKTEINFGICSM